MKRFAILKYNMMIVVSLFLFHSLLPFNIVAQEYIEWKRNFGGGSLQAGQLYFGITAAFDGIVAAGYASELCFGNGDWEGIAGKGSWDAIIVKYDHDGNVTWKKNFGGAGQEEYYCVTAVSDGVVAVGWAAESSFGNGDWEGVANNGVEDAIIVKYDHDGNVVWRKNFGGAGTDVFHSVTAVPDGVVAVGVGNNTFGWGDWEGIAGKGSVDAIIVKYDHDGNVMWKKNFGGENQDRFRSVVAVIDGVIAVGSSNKYSFGTGDWEGIEWKGGAIIIKYDHDGNVIWKKAFGGTGANSGDMYYGVTIVPDGIVAVGDANYGSFGTGDWEGINGKGSVDAIIVKYDYTGNIMWNKNFGGETLEMFHDVAAVSDGIVAVGYGLSTTFGTGDWEAIPGKGGMDAIIVKYDHAGNRVWEKSFGGMGTDDYHALTGMSDNVFAVGNSNTYSFNNGNWDGIEGKSGMDAIVVKYATDSTADIIEPMQPQLVVYPNPTTGKLWVTNSGWQHGRPGEVVIRDIMGKAQIRVPQRYENETTIIDLSHLPPGIYFLQTEGKTVKIIKQ